MAQFSTFTSDQPKGCCLDTRACRGGPSGTNRASSGYEVIGRPEGTRDPWLGCGSQSPWQTLLANQYRSPSTF